MIKTFKKGGIHIAEHKDASATIVEQPLPMRVCLPLGQHIGVPSKALVAKGDKVVRGQIVAEAPSFVSASLAAPVSGTVTALEPVVLPSGKTTTGIVITASQEEHELDTAARESYWSRINSSVPDLVLVSALTPEEISARIAAAGVVGLGGATFPTRVKLSLKPGSKAEVLVVNGCECEPYLMCDDALMRAYPAYIVAGIGLMMKAAGIPRAVIGIEDNKPEAIAALRGALAGRSDISVQVLRTKYPQGGEKQLVEAVTGRRIASGALPLSVGAIVANVATAFAVWQGVADEMPLIERIVTVTGDIPAPQRLNYRVAIGTAISELPFTLPEDAKIVIGGPMMGRAAVCLDAPVTKGTSGITLLAGSRRGPVRACIRCGACLDACPMGLEPYLLARYGSLGRWEDARASDVADCLECGACSYSCPSNRPLLDFIRLAKQKSR